MQAGHRQSGRGLWPRVGAERRGFAGVSGFHELRRELTPASAGSLFFFALQLGVVVLDELPQLVGVFQEAGPLFDV